MRCSDRRALRELLTRWSQTCQQQQNRSKRQGSIPVKLLFPCVLACRPPNLFCSQEGYGFNSVTNHGGNKQVFWWQPYYLPRNWENIPPGVVRLIESSVNKVRLLMPCQKLLLFGLHSLVLLSNENWRAELFWCGTCIFLSFFISATKFVSLCMNGSITMTESLIVTCVIQWERWVQSRRFNLSSLKNNRVFGDFFPLPSHHIHHVHNSYLCFWEQTTLHPPLSHFSVLKLFHPSWFFFGGLTEQSLL